MNETQSIQNNRALRRGDGGIRFFLVNSKRRSRSCIWLANPPAPAYPVPLCFNKKNKEGRK